MSDEDVEQQPEDEAGERPSRVAGGFVLLVLAAVAVVVVKVVVTAAPYVAYVVVGILGTLGWQKVRGWVVRRRGGEGTEEGSGGMSLTEEDVVDTLHQLAAPHVFLTELADELGLSRAETEAVLEEMGVPVRAGVRNGKSTGAGVHKRDLPPLPRSSGEGADRGVDVQQQQKQQGVRVERTDAGFTVFDLTDAARHHKISD